MFWEKTQYRVSQKIMAIMMLCSMIVLLFLPIISNAADDDFPLPETFVDDSSSAQPTSSDGTDGVTGDTGANGDPGLPSKDTSAEDGVDGPDSPASYAENDPQGDADGADGTSTESGTEGADGSDAGSGAGPLSGTGSIITGDATAAADVLNNVNVTQIDAPLCDTCDLLWVPFGDQQTYIDTDNIGTVGNDLNADSMSGHNSWGGRAANVYIKTGDASAYASIINFLNTTVIGSPDIDIINIYGPALGTLDFSDFNPNAPPTDVSSSDSSPLGLGGLSNSTAAFIDTSNQGTLSNDLSLDASSGTNRIVGANGNVVIETGNVEVDASVFNVLNTTLVGRGWKFKVINIFSDLVGDLILPSLYTEKTSAGCSGCLNSLQVTTGNTASVDNAITVNANTGNNTASGVGGEAAIITGDASANASVFNLVDTTIIGDDWYYTQFHVAGTWMGSVFNANSTVDFFNGGHDATVRGEDRMGNHPAAGAEHQTSQGGLFDVSTDNNANIQNIITINADSGGNTIEGALGDAVIRTGDVTAKAAITNVANTTIIGNGWQFYLVNIFGNWKGSAHYGMPDLAVSEVAIPDATPARWGNTITYVYSYTNGGDATAIDVVLHDRFDADKVHVTNPSGGTVRGNMITWRLGTMKPRETRILRYTTTVNASDGSLPVQNEVTVSAGNGDRDPSNNSTGGKVEIAAASSSNSSGNGGYSSPSYGGYYGGSSVSNPAFNLVKVSDRDTYSAGETMPFTIILDNFNPHSGYAVGVVDQFMGPNDDVLTTKVWDLGEVVGFEHIEITYAIPIPETAVAGPYSNQVMVYAKNNVGDILPTVVANLPVTILSRPTPQVILPTFDLLPSAYIFDDTSPQAPTTTTDFKPIPGQIKRSIGTGGSDNQPVVQGYSSIATTGGRAPEQPSQEAVSFDRHRMDIAVLLLIVASILYYVVRKMQEPLSSDKLKV